MVTDIETKGLYGGSTDTFLQHAHLRFFLGLMI